jgi:hypothetical protein
MNREINAITRSHESLSLGLEFGLDEAAVAARDIGARSSFVYELMNQCGGY